jgi:hypothetical protein
MNNPKHVAVCMHKRKLDRQCAYFICKRCVAVFTCCASPLVVVGELFVFSLVCDESLPVLTSVPLLNISPWILTVFVPLFVMLCTAATASRKAAKLDERGWCCMYM